MHHGFGFVPIFSLLAALLLIAGGMMAVFRAAVDPGPDRPDRARLRTRWWWPEREQTQTIRVVEQPRLLALAPPRLRAATGPERGREIVNRSSDFAPRRNESAGHDADDDRGNELDVMAIEQALDVLVQATLRRNVRKALDREGFEDARRSPTTSAQPHAPRAQPLHRVRSLRDRPAGDRVSVQTMATEGLAPKSAGASPDREPKCRGWPRCSAPRPPLDTDAGSVHGPVQRPS